MKPENMSPAELAAYRAVARFRITPGERAAFAAEVVAMLSDLPVELLERGTDGHVESWGITTELARRGLYTIQSVASVKLGEVAAVAVDAACRALLAETAE